MRAVLRCIAESRQDATVYQFFQSHVADLNESLLDALPIIFNKLVANEPQPTRENIAALFLNFADLIRPFPLGNQMLNLELSVTACKLALKIFSRESYPEKWAALHNNLGNAYGDRIQGDRAENLELAIEHFNLALQVYTRENSPEEWAIVHNNLSTVYCDRICGDRTENIELAIDHCNSALQVRTQKDLPYDWATTQNNLGRAYLFRIRGDRAENLERAVGHFNLALQVHTQKTFPIDWAMVHNNLGTTHSDRIRGDRVENREKAIEHFKLALQIYTQEDTPRDWAATHHNLGNAYNDRMWGNRAENLEKAVEHFKLALQFYYKEAYSRDWAMTQSSLARALIQRATLTKNIIDLDTAINLLQTSLTVLLSGDSLFTNSHYLLGNAYSYRYEFSQNSRDIEQAIESFKVALDSISPEHYNRHHIWQALPKTQVVLGSRLVRDGQWQEGLQLLLNSVTQLSTGDEPLAYANALFQTGVAHEVLSDWNNARLYYRDALRLYEHLEDLPGIAKSRAGLGGVLVSQGHLEKGIKELATAQEIYHQLQQPEKAHELESLYQAAQRAMERQPMEICT